MPVHPQRAPAETTMMESLRLTSIPSTTPAGMVYAGPTLSFGPRAGKPPKNAESATEEHFGRATTTDAELVALAKEGGSEGRRAFEVLVRRHHARIVRMVRYLLAGSSATEDVEDVAQDTFVRAFLALPRYDERGDFGAWLRVVATRVAFNHRRRETTRRRYHDTVEPPGSCTSTVSAADALEHALAKLPYLSREILILRYVEEMLVQEIAETLDLGLSATKMRLARARGQFRDAYGEPS